MTRLTPLLSSLKTLDITYPSPSETLLGTPETLPTSEPATPQISYTVSSADLPSFSINVYSKKWVACLYGAGKFTTAGTIYYRMKKNGASVYNSSGSVSANYYYSVRCYFFDVAVGDVLELALWSSVSDSNWDYKAFQIVATRVAPFKNVILKPCNFTSLVLVPNLTLGNPGVQGTQGLSLTLDDLLTDVITGAKTVNAIFSHSTYGIFRTYYGDRLYVNQGTIATHSSYRPYFYKFYVPTRIVFRGLRI